METKNFSDCTTEWITETYNLTRNDDLDILKTWIQSSIPITCSDFEKEAMRYFQKILHEKVDDWNEAELSEHFIGPIIALVNFNTLKFSAFAERPLKVEIGNYFLQGNPDLMVCSGRSTPRQPYFCFHEYKKSLENQGDPKGQLLAAMLVAQSINANKIPIYGVYVTGRFWYFVILKDKIPKTSGNINTINRYFIGIY